MSVVVVCQVLRLALHTATASIDVTMLLADEMTSLLVYVSTRGQDIFGTLPEIFDVN